MGIYVNYMLDNEKGWGMLTPSTKQEGVTLVELIIGLAIAVILMAIGIPSFSQWMHNARIRSTAESLISALQQTRSEAARRNMPVRFQLTDTTTSSCALSANGTNWIISREDPAGKCEVDISETVSPLIIQKRAGNENANVAVAITPSTQTSIVFNSLGRLTPIPAGDISIDISNPGGGTCVSLGGALRCMRLVISPSGQVRMCDPNRANSDPQGC